MVTDNNHNMVAKGAMDNPKVEDSMDSRKVVMDSNNQVLNTHKHRTHMVDINNNQDMATHMVSLRAMVVGMDNKVTDSNRWEDMEEIWEDTELVKEVVKEVVKEDQWEDIQIQGHITAVLHRQCHMVQRSNKIHHLILNAENYL